MHSSVDTARTLEKRGVRSTSRLVSALRLSFLLDLAWLGLASPLESSLPQELIVALIIIALFASDYINVSQKKWQTHIAAIRKLLEGRIGAGMLGLFAAGLTLELTGYFSALIEIDEFVRVIAAVLVGFAVASLKTRILGKISNTDEILNIDPLLITTCWVRLLAILTIFIAPGPVRIIIWLLCTCPPRPPTRGGHVPRPL